MRSDADAFRVTSELTAYDSGEQVFMRRWEHHIPRDNV
jgi:hypothetical protein